MAPKKKPQKQNPKKKPSPLPSATSSSSSSSGPRLQISAENENRLRRLLLNSGRSAAQPAPPAQENLSKAQKAKKLGNLYERLSCEGFSDDQIELALSSLKDNSSFEAALDWLCLNLPGSELPLKFSTGTSVHPSGGSVGIISTGKGYQIPTVDKDMEIKEDVPPVSIKIKGQKNDDPLDSCEPSQADWIKQYLLQQEEEEESMTWKDNEAIGSFVNEVPEPRAYDVIAKEYCAARLEAAKAKDIKDKKSQDQASQHIRQLKQELSLLGISDEILAWDIENKFTFGYMSEGPIDGSMLSNDAQTEPNTLEEAAAVGLIGNDLDSLNPPEGLVEPVKSGDPAQRMTEDELRDVELGDLFLDDGLSTNTLPSEVLELQKMENIRALWSGKNLEKLHGIWKQGDPQKIPKAVLQQLCQKSGWEAPKFSKIQGKDINFAYAVSILRKSSGRGKSRKAGGLITIQLPDDGGSFESAEDAQNRTAAFALHQLFPDLPIHLVLVEPYASLAWHWREGETAKKVEDSVKDRRAGFVDRLLSANVNDSNAIADVGDSFSDKLEKRMEEAASPLKENRDLTARRPSNHQDMESSSLRQCHETKMKMPKYQEMLKARTALPIAGLGNNIMQKLEENDVLLVCGETGSGKTTQVPQFILDDMILSGFGGCCNIICTQPRRIAAISVAQRVADERCEPSPGSNGSLVGYQVRLESARNENTKLLFCTTGILLRKLVGDRSLTGISHLILDEVHERSLLGDFLLAILKNLIEKQATDNRPRLKVILMSATVDSSLFSSYFGHCPVLHAQGRTHTVTNYFLEDVYESMGYKLASDSPAALGYGTPTFDKDGSVNNRRGKKNLVLSAWGDDSLLSEERCNPHYISSAYESYSEQTQKNLKRLNEDVIDYDLLEDLVSHIDDKCDDGAVLIFLPGISEIHLLVDRLTASYHFGGPSADWILPLHSTIASTDQKMVFAQPPKGVRKIIIATNIAETSITIDDVVFVIDCGKHKENRYDPRKKLTSMVEDWISQANVQQRRGRAGRVKPGICFCMYTRYRYEKLMRPYQVPEMLRMPLVELCLQIKLLSLGYVKPFLLKAVEPPREEAVNSALSLLYEVGALEGDEQLTPLGYLLAKLPVDVLIGKMMLYGAIFGCLSPILSISAFLSYKTPFLYPKDERHHVERAKLSLLTDTSGSSSDSSCSDVQSDHLIMMVAYQKWAGILYERGVKAAQQFCTSYYLSSSVMYMIRDMRIQLGTLLADIAFINIPDYQIVRKKEKFDLWLSEKSQPFNMYSQHPAVLKAILCAGLYPHVAATEEGVTAGVLNSLRQSSRVERKGQQAWYDGRREVHIHPSSINSSIKAFRFPFIVFLEKVETTKIFLRDTTVISPFSILLFGGPISVQHQSGLVTVDGWLKLNAPAQTAVLFKELRITLHSLLKELIQKPEKATGIDNEVVRSVIHLLLDEDRPMNQ